MPMIQRLMTIIIWGVMITALPAFGEEKPADVNSIKAFGPESLKVVCGDVLIRIDGPKMWTLSRIEYKGALLGIEDSAYGTVFKFPEIGFLGTGHFLDRPDGKEDVKKLDFYLDGRQLDSSAGTVNGGEFKLHKVSRILECGLDSIIELRNNRIYETAVITTDKQVPLDLVYNFMHAWTPSATGVLARSSGGEELNSLFDDSGRKEYLLKDIEWMAVYDANSGKGAVSCLFAKPAAGGADFLIVNAPKVYRKYYIMSFTNQTVPNSFNGTYKIVTGFFEAKPDKWQDAARKLSQDMNKTKIIKNKK